jgi:hypothetical protein
MAGHAMLRDGSGNQVRANCTVTRQSETSNQFHWQCDPADAQASTGAAGQSGGK